MARAFALDKKENRLGVEPQILIPDENGDLYCLIDLMYAVWRSGQTLYLQNIAPQAALQGQQVAAYQNQLNAAALQATQWSFPAVPAPAAGTAIAPGQWGAVGGGPMPPVKSGP